MLVEQCGSIVESALARHPERHQQWIKQSFAIGSLRPNSLLMPDIQLLGQLDIILFCLEDEISSGSSIKDDIWGGGFFMMQSKFWLRHSYSTLFAVKHVSDNVGANALFHDVDRIRTNIEKYMIPKDNLIKPDSDNRKQIPIYDEDGNLKRCYDRDDPKRSMIVGGSLCADGSVQWPVFGAESGPIKTLTRREVAERYLALRF